MESPQKAPRACQACRRLKRKCSRDLPTCSLCIRLKKPCRYPPVRRTLDSDTQGQHGLLGRVQELEERLAASFADTTNDNVAANSISGATRHQESPSRFPVAFFLDTDLFAPLPNTSLTTGVEVPSEILGHINPEPWVICECYLARIHPWFPIISRKRLHQHIQRLDDHRDPSIHILLVAMKLVSNSPEDDDTQGKSALYLLFRHYYNILETSSIISLSLLQAVILLTLYELGQGIFPAAYLTVGRAARLCSLVGGAELRGATRLFKQADTWTMREEERRAWWAIFILERVINIGPSGLPLAIPDPTTATLLPVADSRWFRGELGPSEALFTREFHSSANLGPFARTCQAAHVLSKVQQHRASSRHMGDGTADRTATVTEALRLHATLVALDAHLAQQQQQQEQQEQGQQEKGQAEEADARNGTGGGVAVDLAICCSARILLYDMYGCNFPEHGEERIALETEMQAASLDGLAHVVRERAIGLARAVLLVLGDSGNDNGFAAAGDSSQAISPLITDCLYASACACKWYVKESMYPDIDVVLDEIIRALEMIGRRWQLARHYLLLLESY
ncbi:hypothetical protein BX600DRAFT_148377 [Xylariales sp. PMI_506]|nr:hypothetical protein BX600DRAFT_148377 [Xylariales sp. PMI_506]